MNYFHGARLYVHDILPLRLSKVFDGNASHKELVNFLQ